MIPNFSAFLKCVPSVTFIQSDLDLDLESGPGPSPADKLQGGSRHAKQPHLIDGATRLLVRMAVPGEGRKRLFFTSKAAAEATRQFMVLERGVEIMYERQRNEQRSDAVGGQRQGFLDWYVACACHSIGAYVTPLCALV